MRKNRKRTPVLERLFKKVHIPVNKDGTNSKKQCWEWQGVVNNAGYGLIRVDEEVGMATVHRVVMVEHNKKMNYGDKVEVLHNCGNKNCVNPDHLICGDIRDRRALQIKYNNINNETFFNKEFMNPVCKHCGESTYLPHFKRLHRLCEDNAKHKYILDTLAGKLHGSDK
jgi:hypothetical protein